MSRVALVVGINQYSFLKDPSTGKYQHLKTPASDAEAIAQLLETCGNFKVQRLPVSNIDGKLQVDPNKLVKAEELEKAIANLFLPESGRTPETALLFFAGHGFRKPLGRLAQGFLATSDASPTRNQWGMSLRDLREILQASSVRQQIIWLDCCFSGELLNFKETDLGGQGSGCDRFFVAASLDYEVAYQQLDAEHGVLTGTLLKGLDPYQIPEYEWITDRTLAVAVERHLKAYYAQAKIPQTPLISNHGQPIQLLQKRGIPQSEAKNEEADKKLEGSKPHLLFDLLLQMDFKQQVRLVRKVMTLHRVAAFLIHGEPYCGQQLLVTRLFRLKPQWKNISPIKIDVSHNGVGRSIPHLWRQVGSWFRLPKDAQPNEIIERVCDRLLTQDVIFIFYTVDYMLPKVLGAWLQEFWEPLVERVKTDCCPTPEGTHLLMFLVDNSGSVCQSNIVLARQCEQPEYPRIPLHLPPVSPFPPDVLDDWLDMVTGFADVQMPAGLTSQILLEKSEDGIPEFIYEEICYHCGHDWEGGMAKWLI
jgi:hypothetical protein